MVFNMNSDDLQYNLRSSGSITSNETREEYINKLQKWIDDVRKHNERTFALWCSYAAQLQVHYVQLPNANSNPVVTAPNDPLVVNRPGFYIYIIPPMWKRMVAEVIDFLILFVIKMFLTIIILESFDVIFSDLENYGLNSFHKKLQNPKLAMQMSMEILTLEILHRFIVCCYETYWLVLQCATPGKRYMGLAVVHAVNVAHVQGQLEETVLAHPCTALSIKDAILRTLLKNVFIGLLLPICFVLLFFKYNRTGYDLMTNSLVVEYNPNPPTQEHR